MGIVHGLQLDAGVRAVPCRLGEEVLQGLQHLKFEVKLMNLTQDILCFQSETSRNLCAFYLLEEVALHQTCLKHLVGGE